MERLKQDYIKRSVPLEDKVFSDTVYEILEFFHETKNLTVLDVGSGNGKYSFALAPKVKKVIGVEPFKELYDQAVANNHYKNVKFIFTKVEDLKTDERFDLVISLTTLEHMPDAKASFDRIFKLLKPGGIIYLTAPNKLWPWELHYKLWFLNYLPLPLANFYLRLMRKGESFEDSSYAKTYFGLKSFFKQYPCSFEFLLPDPNLSYLGCGLKGKSKFRTLGINLIKHFPIMWIFSKGFIMLLRKNEKS